MDCFAVCAVRVHGTRTALAANPCKAASFEHLLLVLCFDTAVKPDSNYLMGLFVSLEGG